MSVISEISEITITALTVAATAKGMLRQFGVATSDREILGSVT
jgi:hypothetical protein